MHLRHTRIISLKAASARRKSMQAVCEEEELEYSFYDAINPSIATLDAEKCKKYLQGRFSDDMTAAKRPGTYGCSLSHMQLWQDLDEMPRKLLDVDLIMEDDVSLSPNFRIQLCQVLSELPHDFDICFLAGWPPDPRFRLSQPRISPTLARMKHFCLTSTGIYLIAASRIQRIQKIILPLTDEIDVYIGNLRAQLNIFLYAGSAPCALTQVTGGSERDAVDGNQS